MKYPGSKLKHAKHIIPIMLRSMPPLTPWVEPFVGCANLTAQLPQDGRKKFCSDMNAEIIACLTAVRDGWIPPSEVSEEEYRRAKAGEGSLYLRGFISVACSFGGKAWGGYARGSGRNYAAESVRNLQAQYAGLQDVVFECKSYEAATLTEPSLVYCDPPYAETTGYGRPFDHVRFWQWCDDLIENGHRVFVSEYVAPADWVSVWEKIVVSSLDLNTGDKHATERLFTKRTA